MDPVGGRKKGTTAKPTASNSALRWVLITYRECGAALLRPVANRLLGAEDATPPLRLTAFSARRFWKARPGPDGPGAQWLFALLDFVSAAMVCAATPVPTGGAWPRDTARPGLPASLGRDSMKGRSLSASRVFEN